MTAFRWVHFTDLHAGHPSFAAEIPTIKEELYKDLRFLTSAHGGWDFVLFSGDLTNRGSTDEFDSCLQVVSDLFDTFKDNCQPVLLSVPGNHDLSRPECYTAAMLCLMSHFPDSQDVVDGIFNDLPSEYKEALERLFANYRAWITMTKSFHPETIQHGRIPGDFTASISKDGARLGVLGLNTAFQHLNDNVKKISISPRQFDAACIPDRSSWAASHNACILMTHHPRTWLTVKTQEELNCHIAPNGRFFLEVCGHLHSDDLDTFARGASEPRHVLHGRSLFGLRDWKGTDDEQSVNTNRERIYGYSFCELELNGSSGKLRVWPRRMETTTAYRLVANNTQFTLERGTEHTRKIDVTCRQTSSQSNADSMPASSSQRPELVQVQAGRFKMGSDIDEERERESDVRRSKRYEGPRVQISVPRAIYVGKYPVTFSQWEVFADDCTVNTGLFDSIRNECRAAGIYVGKEVARPKDLGWGGDVPVVNVSWHDAHVYLAWLSRTTRKKYRLLTEAEWEYCCRAGTETEYWFGDDIDPTKANYGMNSQRPSNVGTLYKANDFGLWDMSGQVWEWVADPWHPSHFGRPSDSGQWAQWALHELRVVRGGSWRGSKESLRSASRSFQVAEHRVDNIGFRVAMGEV